MSLTLFQSLLPVWTHDGSPATAIQVNKHVEHFKNALASNPRFLQDKVKQYFKVSCFPNWFDMTCSNDTVSCKGILFVTSAWCLIIFLVQTKFYHMSSTIIQGGHSTLRASVEQPQGFCSHSHKKPTLWYISVHLQRILHSCNEMNFRHFEHFDRFVKTFKHAWSVLEECSILKTNVCFSWNFNQEITKVFTQNIFETSLYFTDDLPISSCSRCQDNQHRLTLTMKPDEEFEMKRRKLEEKKLADVLASLSEEERSSIYEKGRRDYCKHRSFCII